MQVRRVVTGVTKEGKSVVVSDTRVSALTLDLAPGYEFCRLWGADETVRLPSDGSPPSYPAYFPPVGGFRFGLFTVPPDARAKLEDLDFEAALVEIEEKLPGMAAHMERDDPGMHTTDTIDFAFVISGELWLEMDDGQDIRLGAGDTVVQNGTRHAWRNRGSEPCSMVVCLIGAQRT